MTICWTCKRATGFCAWSKYGKPVKGWAATPTRITESTGEITRSYIVRACPLYLAEPIRCKLPLRVLVERTGIPQKWLSECSDDTLVLIARKAGYKSFTMRSETGKRFLWKYGEVNHEKDND